MINTYKFQDMSFQTFYYEAVIEARTQKEAWEKLKKEANWKQVGDSVCTNNEISIIEAESDCTECDPVNDYLCFDHEREAIKEKYPNAVYTDQCTWEVDGKEVEL